jgi:putative tricarboxylic transport membrane protein
MKWLNLIVSFSVIGFSLLILALSLKLGFGSPQSPGPGFMPFLASIVLLSLSLLVLITGEVQDGKKKLFITWEVLKKPIGLAFTLCGYSFVLEILGWLFSTFLLMFLMLSIYDPRKWHVNLLFSAIVANLSFLIFYKWLAVQLPMGIFHLGW